MSQLLRAFQVQRSVLTQASRQQLRAYTCMDELPHMKLMAKDTSCEHVGCRDALNNAEAELMELIAQNEMRRPYMAPNDFNSLMQHDIEVFTRHHPEFDKSCLVWC